MNTNDLKVAIVVIAKNENLYIRDFVEYHKRLGFTNIILYDNNEIDGEKLKVPIYDHILSGYVIYNNIRGLKTTDNYVVQYDIIEKSFEKYKHEYDWLFYIDVDEYLELLYYKSVQEFINDPMFTNNDIDCIHLNWMMYDDNDQLFYSPKPVYERFTRPAYWNKIYRSPLLKVPLNFLGKFFVRCGDYSISVTSAHFITVKDKPHTLRVRSNGQELPFSRFDFWPMDYSKPYIKHYAYKSIAEYTCRKCIATSTRCAIVINNDFRTQFINDFFFSNEKTPEKVEILNKILKDSGTNITYS